MKAVICGVLLFVIAVVAISNRQVETLHDFFNNIDKNGDAKIDIQELIIYDKFLSKVESPDGSYHPPLEHQLKTVMNRIDIDNSNSIDFNEFVAITPNHYSSNKQDPSYYYEVDVEQVHLSYTEDPSSIWVMWITKADEIPPTTTVKYGLQSKTYTYQTKGTNHTYSAGVFGWYGWIHQVQLTGLLPNTVYYYVCGDSSTGWSNEYYFTTSTSSPLNRPYHYAVMGDMGTYIPMGFAVTDQMVSDNAKYNFDMVMHVGDICYAGTGSTDELEYIWDIWGNQVEPLAAYVPYMFAVGNHEHYYNWAAYTNRFILPGNQSEGNGNFWWSMNNGYVHWLQMSTEHPYDVGSPQYDWIVSDLTKASLNRKNVPWIIVTGHRPMYCSDVAEWSSHEPGAYFQKLIEPLFIQFKVDLYLCGHMHMYERVYPVIDGNVTATGNTYHSPKGTAHVVQGTGGVFTDYDYIDPQPVWSAARNADWGYGKMTVFNATTLHYEFLHEDDGSVVDEFWILK